jgi:hypothetical protein
MDAFERDLHEIEQEQARVYQRWPSRIIRLLGKIVPHPAIVVILITGLTVVGRFVIDSQDAGTSAALLALAQDTTISFSAIGIFWLAISGAALPIGKRISVLSWALLFLVFVLPIVNAKLDAATIKEHKIPGHGLPTIQMSSLDQLGGDWTLNDGLFVSPRLRLVGQGSGFIIVWNPVGSGSSIRFAQDHVIKMEQR